MKKLNLTDVAMLLTENRESPKHVGALSLYTLPPRVNQQKFLQQFAESLRNVDEFVSPFGDRLKIGRLGLAGPVYWETDASIDVDYHIRHSALPEPGRYRELFTLISRLHGSLLDRSRPLWEMHLIEGLQNRQFAVYQKIHHAAMDGGRGSHLMQSMLSADPKGRLKDSPLSKANWERYRSGLQRERKPDIGEKELRTVAELLSEQFESSANYYQVLKRFNQAWWDSSNPLSLPFKKVPASPINTNIEGARRFVAQSWSFDRVRAVSKSLGGTFNDAILSMCSGAIRRYLQQHASLPGESLKAMVPVSVRREGDLETSNAMAMISADLATNIADAGKRFSTIQASTQAGKDFYRGLSPSETILLSTVMQAPGILLGPLGLADRFPAFNTIISNVPGVQETMYTNGARLDGTYPVSMLADGVALNITVHTYNRNVDVGIVACRRSLPQVQRMIDYMDEALLELEQAAGLSASNAKRRKPVSKRKTAKKSKKN